MKKKILVLLAILALAAFAVVVFNNYKTKTSFKYRDGDYEKSELKGQDAVNRAIVEEASRGVTRLDSKVLEVSPFEFALGKKDAPVVMVEYASLSCPHCAAFYNEAFDDFKEDFVDSGKVRFVYRDFPLNQQALAAALTAICRTYGEDNRAEVYYDFLEKLFKAQDVWAFDPNYIKKLENIAVLEGMSQADFQGCIDDKKLQKKVLQARMIASKSLEIASTPTFFINGERVEGYVDYRTLKKAIRRALR